MYPLYAVHLLGDTRRIMKRVPRSLLAFGVAVYRKFNLAQTDRRPTDTKASPRL